MSRNPASLNVGDTSSTDLLTLYTASSVVAPTLVLTNNSATKNTVNVYINNGVDDRLIESVKLPQGIGNAVIVRTIATQKINSSFSVKIQLENATSVNYFLSGSVIEE